MASDIALVSLETVAVFDICIHSIADDSTVRQSAEDGRIGYSGGTATIKGFWEQIPEWNDHEMGKV